MALLPSQLLHASVAEDETACPICFGTMLQPRALPGCAARHAALVAADAAPRAQHLSVSHVPVDTLVTRANLLPPPGIIAAHGGALWETWNTLILPFAIERGDR